MNKKYEEGGHATIYINKRRYARAKSLLRSKGYTMSGFVDDIIGIEFVKDWIASKRESEKVVAPQVEQEDIKVNGN